MPDTSPMSTPATHRQAPNLSVYRDAFPSLALLVGDQPAAYLDNPGGTQVPRVCIEAISSYLTTANANTYGAYLTSERTVAMLDAAHAGMAALLGAADPREIVFGPNMTTLTFALSRAIGRTLKPGDEIIVTALDHDANVAPWLALEEERGVVVRVAEIELPSCTLDMAGLKALVNQRTKLIAVGYASNAAGTINDVATIIGWAREAGALSFIDAVQFAPHGPIDVRALDCDFLACSAYKFFGPHLGIIYGKLNLLESIAAYKVRPSDAHAPGKWETGTQNHECLAGLVATLDYLAGLGREQMSAYADVDAVAGATGQRRDLLAAMYAIQEYERELVARLLAGLATLPGAHIYGLTAAEDLVRRVPTVALTVDGHSPRELAAALGARGIFAWDGNYYAVNLMERLGLEASGGALRLGLAHYNTAAEVDRTLAALHEIVGA